MILIAFVLIFYLFLIKLLNNINYVESACLSKMIEFLPGSLRDLFKNKVLNIIAKFDMCVLVRYSHITDKSFLIISYFNK